MAHPFSPPPTKIFFAASLRLYSDWARRGGGTLGNTEEMIKIFWSIYIYSIIGMNKATNPTGVPNIDKTEQGYTNFIIGGGGAGALVAT